MFKSLLTAACITSASGLINGGSIVNQGTMDSHYPWFVSLVEISNGECVPSCGGAMIAPGTFVTAAHCLADDEPTPNLKEMFAVIGFAGPYGVRNADFPNPCNRDTLEAFFKKSKLSATVRAIDNFKKPIHYNKVPGYDILLAFLSEDSCPAADDIKMPTVQIHGQCSEVKDWIPDAKKITLLGFGATMGEQGKPSDVLKKLEMPVQSIGTSDDICNIDVAQDNTFPSVVCSKERPAENCEDKDGNPTPDAPGCTPGMKGAAGDSGGPWVADSDGQNSKRMVKAFTQSSGQVNDKGVSYGYLIRDAWFQDFILFAVNRFDKCGGASMVGKDIFVGYHTASEAQYCEGSNCEACMDSTVTKHDCLNDYRTPGSGDDDADRDGEGAGEGEVTLSEGVFEERCAIAPTVVGCKTIPTAEALRAPSCDSEPIVSGSSHNVFAKVCLMLIAALLYV